MKKLSSLLLTIGLFVFVLAPAHANKAEFRRLWKKPSDTTLKFNFEQSLRLREAIEDAFDVSRDEAFVKINRIRCSVEARADGYSEFGCRYTKGSMDYALVFGSFAQQVFGTLDEVKAQKFPDLDREVIGVRSLICWAEKDPEGYVSHSCEARPLRRAGW